MSEFLGGKLFIINFWHYKFR